MLAQQNREFEESRQRDQDREDERKQREEQEQKAALDAEQKAAAREERLEQIRKALPAEPTESKGSNVTRIKFNFPHGKSVVRKFYTTNTVEHLRNFVELYIKDEVEPSIQNFSLACNFPKKTLFSSDSEELEAEEKEALRATLKSTLEEEKLCPQVVLFIQDLDS